MTDSVFRTFAHINEFDDSAWRALPAWCAMSAPLTLWGPSGTAIQGAHARGVAPYSPSEILDAIEMGGIRVIAREEWLLDKRRRSSALQAGEYFGRKWLDGFDDRLAMLAEVNDDRVRIVPPEDGWRWAEEQLEQKSQVVEVARGLLDRALVPKGTLERVRRALSAGPAYPEREAIKIILRDTKNHADAKQFAGANLFVEDDSGAIGFHALADPPVEEFRVGPDVQVSAERVHDLVDTLAALTGEPSLAALIELSTSARVKEEIAAVTTAEFGVRRTIRHAIREGLHPIELPEFLGLGVHPDCLQVSATLTTLVGAYAAARRIHARGPLSRRDFLKFGKSEALTAVALAGLTDTALRVALQYAGVAPDTHYTGWVFPFLLHFGTNSPRVGEIGAMIDLTAET